MHRPTRRPLVALASLLLVATAPACSRGGGAPDVPFVAVDSSSGSPTDKAIAKAQATLRNDPEDGSAQLALAQAFLQKVRETADPTLYGKAEQLLDLLAKDHADDPRVIIAQGVLALARHQFAEGLALGKRALAAAPGNEAAYGVVVDAANELGLYDESLRASQAMVDIRPSVSSLSRVSYARELRGDLDGAILAMSQAVTAAGGAGGENVAYVQVQLGNLLIENGELVQARRSYDDAERSFPKFPAIKVGRAKLAIAYGRYDEAAALLKQAIDVQPVAEYAIEWGDALSAAGHAAKAKEAYALVDAIAKLYRANGVNVDLELALFDAEVRPGKASVARARRAEKLRPSILGHDVLSWNLFRAGKVPEAAAQSKLALATGSQDPLLRFHAAAIASAAGDAATARRDLELVLDTDPRFNAGLVDDVKTLAGHLGLEVPPPPTR